MTCPDCGAIDMTEEVPMYGNGVVLTCAVCGAELDDEPREAGEAFAWPVEYGEAGA